MYVVLCTYTSCITYHSAMNRRCDLSGCFHGTNLAHRMGVSLSNSNTESQQKSDTAMFPWWHCSTISGCVATPSLFGNLLNVYNSWNPDLIVIVIDTFTLNQKFCSSAYTFLPFSLLAEVIPRKRRLTYLSALIILMYPDWPCQTKFLLMAIQ